MHEFKFQFFIRGESNPKSSYANNFYGKIFQYRGIILTLQTRSLKLNLRIGLCLRQGTNYF